MASEAAEHDPAEATEIGLERRYEVGQEMVVNYAIGLALLGLFHAFLTPALVIAAFLLIKMLADIARLWRFSLPLNPIPILGQLLNILGACAIALLAWATLVFLGAFLPLVDHYALAAALMSGTWTLGASANQFFMNGFLRRRSQRPARLRHA